MVSSTIIVSETTRAKPLETPGAGFEGFFGDFMMKIRLGVVVTKYSFEYNTHPHHHKVILKYILPKNGTGFTGL
jgi:hypothetical protein